MVSLFIIPDDGLRATRDIDVMVGGVRVDDWWFQLAVACGGGEGVRNCLDRAAFTV